MLTMEAEFYAASQVGSCVLGLCKYVEEIKCGVECPMQMMMDNQAALQMLESEEASCKAKHVDARSKKVVSLCEDRSVETSVRGI